MLSALESLNNGSITCLSDIFNPDCIVISGGMCGFVDIKKLEERINSESVVTPVKVKLAETKNNAGMIGAGLLALQ